MAEPCILGVLGKPILQSRSPAMQRAALRAAGIEGAYLRIAADSFSAGLTLAEEVGFTGLNITAPFKEDAAVFVGAAEGSVNTIWNLRQRQGTSTDGYGVVMALRSVLPSLGETPIVILGAGGAARAACGALVRAGAHVTVLARSEERAHELGRMFGVPGYSLESRAAATALARAAVVVSCVSDPTFSLPETALPKAGILLNALYGQPSRIEGAARAAGMVVIPGTEWLLYQGANAFQHFTGQEADLNCMRQALRDSARPSQRHLALVGLMGAGKSTVAPLLGTLLDRITLDLDELIAGQARRSVWEIFHSEGEDAFRRRERAALIQALEAPPSVIACGGGIVCDPANLQALLAQATVVWLWVSPERAAARVRGSTLRPLLSVGDPVRALTQKLSERRLAYAHSDLVISTHGETPAQIAERIAYEVRSAS